MRLYYSILKFVPDPVREECLNLGVVAVTDEKECGGQFNTRVRSKVHSLAPDFPIEQVATTVVALNERFAQAGQLRLSVPNLSEQIRTPEQLNSLAESMNNQFQLSAPRVFNAESLERGIRELYQIFVSPILGRTPRAPYMTRQQLLAVIWKTIRRWGENTPYRVIREQPLMGRKAQHAADFWVQNGVPTAAIYAIPDHPLDLPVALAYRDSLPTVVADFREMNSSFVALAVVPTGKGDIAGSPFLSETISFLEGFDGVSVVSVDDLPKHKSDAVRQPF